MGIFIFSINMNNYGLTDSVYDQRSSDYLWHKENQESPSKLRVQQLSDKLANLQTGLEEEKTTRKDQFEYKIHALDEKCQRNQMAEETKFKLLKDQITKLSE